MKIPDIISIIKGWVAEWRAYLAEFLGTFVFVLIASLAVVVESLYGGLGILGIALAIGFSYAALVFASVHLAGGFLNPALTLALWLSQKLSGTKTVFFIIFQVLASFAAGGVLLLIFGANALQFGLGGPALGVNVSLQTAVLTEALMTAGLVFVTFATMVDRGGPVSFGPLVLGLILVGETIAALPISGAAFNPARAIGPAVLAKSVDSLAVWIIGPLLGSLVGVVYSLLFLKKSKR